MEPDPAHYFATDLDFATLLVSEQRCLVRAPLSAAVAAPGGRMSIGVLMTLFDVGASQPALVAGKPDWTATQDLSIHSAAGVVKGPAVLDCRLVRVGKKVITVSAAIYDTQGLDDLEPLAWALEEPAASGLPLAATGFLTFTRLPRTAASGVDDYDPARWLGEVQYRDGKPVEGTIAERMGLRVIDAAAGVLDLERTPYVANSIGTINGGAQAIHLQVAAEGLRPGGSAVDMQLHFLSQVKAGPVRSSATVLRETAHETVVDVALVDAGHHEQLIARATVTVQD
jgi:acyl-coenzyme A thioesterase PaaI-like protein